MNPEIEVKRLLKEHGAELVRHKKHDVWKFPNGRIFPVAHTPSDYRAHANQLSDLRKCLGISDPARGQPGERRQQKTSNHSATVRYSGPTADGALQDKLRGIGLAEDSLRAQISVLKLEVRRADKANRNKRIVIKALKCHVDFCWWCWATRKARNLVKGALWHLRKSAPGS